MGLAERVGLGRPELRAWAAYDLANSAFITIIVTAVFPIWFIKVAASGLTAAQASQRLALATSIALTASALLGPLLGALADTAPIKKRLLGGFMAVGVAGTAAMFFLRPGEWGSAAILFGLTNVAATASIVFYDALLPHIARPEEMDRVSTAGYALGYVGGTILLVVDLLLIERHGWFGIDKDTGTRLAFVSVAVWWLLFSVPTLRRVPEPPIAGGAVHGLALATRSFARLAGTFRELRRYRQAMLFLVAFLLYNDGIGTIIRMATAFGTEIGLGTGTLIVAIIMTQVIGVPASFAFGSIAGRLGTKRAIYVGLATYCVVSVLGYFMTSATHFYLLAALVGLVQGGTQALSRSLFASMIPPSRSSEFFGLFGVFEKFAGIFGPAVFGIVSAIGGSSRGAILAVIGFFVLGGLLLAPVDVEAGRRAAREAP
jgi:UMF1 family MFS transporter